MKKMFFLKKKKSMMAIVLCIAMLVPSISGFATEPKPKEVTRIYTKAEAEATYLKSDDVSLQEYPTGAFMFPLTNGQLGMEQFYELEVFRQGGTSGTASIQMSTLDLNAHYGRDYEIFLEDTAEAAAVIGEAKPYYEFGQYSFIPRISVSEVVYATNSIEDSEETRAMTIDAINTSVELIPQSSVTTLEFADGEASKTIYIQTYQKKEVTDDLHFTLNLSHPVGANVGEQSSVAFSITEEREKPKVTLEVTDTKVNPNSDEAYVIVQRSGNLDTFFTYNFITDDGTAIRGEDYRGLQQEYDFTAGMVEQKIPIEILDGAEDKTDFKVRIDVPNAENIDIIRSEATVSITEEVPAESIRGMEQSIEQSLYTISDLLEVETSEAPTLTGGDVTIDELFGIGDNILSSEEAAQYVTKKNVVQSGTPELVSSTSSNLLRESEDGSKYFVNLREFTEDTVSNNHREKSYYTYHGDENTLELYMKSDSALINDGGDALAVRSKEKIDFTGIDYLSFSIDPLGGSVAGDKVAVYIGDNALFNSNTEEFDFIETLDDNGAVRGSWHALGNVASSQITVTSPQLTQSLVGGEKYLYLLVYRGGTWGHAAVNLYDGMSRANPTENIDYNLTLHKKNYTMEINDPDPITIYENGAPITQKPKEGITLVDPKGEAGTTIGKKVVDFYMDNTIALMEPSAGLKTAKLQGYVFLDPSNKQNTSELVAFDSDVYGNPYIKMDGAKLRTYADYFDKNGKCIIKPVYDVSTANLTIDPVTVDLGNGNVQRFEMNADNKSMTCYYNNTVIGTVTWTQTNRANGEYKVGDEIVFQWKKESTEIDGVWTLALNYRKASTQAGIEQAIDEKKSGQDTIEMLLDENYVNIKPEAVREDAESYLYVTNPTEGEFTGKDGDYTRKEGDALIVEGDTIEGESGEQDVIYKEMETGEVISFYAKPKEGYRAVWNYTSAYTREVKTFHGETFFYLIQDGYELNDNRVTLSFEKVEESTRESVNVAGTISMQKGTILSPPTEDTKEYTVAKYASLTIGSHVALSEYDGKFVLLEDVSAEQKTPAMLETSADEVLRTLVFYNNQYHLVDMKMADYLATKTDNAINLDVKVDYNPVGAKPKSIVAYNGSNEKMPATMELIRGEGIRFELLLDLTKQSEQKPVNTVRWTIEDENGTIQAPRDDILTKDEQGNLDVISEFADQLGDIMNVNNSIHVELLHVERDSEGESIQETSYGKFNTGYTFYRSNANESVAYAPDMGAPPGVSIPTPAIGPFSPMISIAGFTPILGTEIKEDELGRTVRSMTIGLTIGQTSDQLAEDKSFKDVTPKTKADKMGSYLGNYQKYHEQKGTKDAVGFKDALKLKTAFKITYTMTIAYQADFYVNDNGIWTFVSNTYMAGFGLGVRGSYPFTVYGVPCFVFVTFEGFLGVYMEITAEKEQEYLTSQNVADIDVSTGEGVGEITADVGFGLGVGFDSLVSASGNIDTKVEFEFYDFEEGLIKIDLKGGIKLEFLMFKYAWSDTIIGFEVYDSTKHAATMQSELSENLLKNVTLDDMNIRAGSASTPNELTDNTIHTVDTETELGTFENSVKPTLTQIDEDTYLATAVIGRTEGETTNDSVYYWMFENGVCTEKGFVIDKLLKDIEESIASSEADPMISDEVLEEAKAYKAVLEDAKGKIDSDMSVTACGDDILFTWTKAGLKYDATVSNTHFTQSVGIASVYYNTVSKTFHNYSFIGPDNTGTTKSFYHNPKAVYNEEGDFVQLFYEKVIATNLKGTDSIESLQKLPSVLETRIQNTDMRWSDGQALAHVSGEEKVSYYDVESIGKENIISFVATKNSGGFTLESIQEYIDAGDVDTTQMDVDAFDTKNSLYVQKFGYDEDGEFVASKALELSSDEDVIANPKFTQVESEVNGKTVKNLLLFYKYNGKYGYQNMNTMYNEGIYKDEQGGLQVLDSYKKPSTITTEYDYTINDDFQVISNGEVLYAVWTTVEGGQQQLWTRSFKIDEVVEITKKPVIKDGEIQYTDETTGEYKTEDLETPAYRLSGHWGEKTYLTEGGVNGGETGMFKEKFDLAIDKNGNLVAIYNTYDMQYKDGQAFSENNKLVIGTFDPKPEFEAISIGESNGQPIVDVSDVTPTTGETVKVTGTFTNIGIETDNDVKVSLLLNGEVIDTLSYPTWVAGDTKVVEMDYVLPEGMDPSQVNLSMQVESSSGVYASGSKALRKEEVLAIESLDIMPVNVISETNPSANYEVIATIKNIGNEDYSSGRYLQLMEENSVAIARAMDKDTTNDGEVALTMYGHTEIPALRAGEQKVVSFITTDIPESTFTRTAADAAKLIGIVTDESNLAKNTYLATDVYTEYSSFNPGLTRAARVENVESATLSDTKVQIGKTKAVALTVVPNDAIIGKTIQYQSADEGIATINSAGIVTGIAEGICDITATVNGVTTTGSVTVTKEAVIDPPTDPSNPADPTAKPGVDNTNTPLDTGDDLSIKYVLLLICLFCISGTMIIRIMHKKKSS